MEKGRQDYPRSSPFVQHYEFFKVYISQFCSNHLQIPRGFLKNFKGGQPKKVALKNLAGRHWVLGLELNEGGLFLKKGWSNFIKDNSLEDGEFLVFRYNERSGLTVRIFGVDACKKEDCVKNDSESETQGDDQLAHNQRNSRKRRKINNVACGSKPSTSKSQQLTSATEEEIERALESAKTFTSENPFFVDSIRRNFQKCNVSIPKWIAEKYVNPKKEERVDITLTVLGRSWPINCWCKNGTRIQRGWYRFVADNSLQIGDACVFELMKGTNDCFNVVLFRAGKENVGGGTKPSTSKSPHLTSATEEEKESALESAKTFTSEKLFFIAAIKKHSRQYNVFIPKWIANEYVNPKKEENVEITLTISGRSWPINCVCKRGTRIRRGWPLFVTDNRLQFGDVCVFELIKNDCFNVVIFRAGKNVNC